MLATGRADPALLERPEITPDMAIAWRVWQAIGGERDGWTGRVPLRAAIAWLDEEQIRDPDLRSETLVLVETLEDELQAYRKAHPSPPPPPPRDRRR